MNSGLDVEVAWDAYWTPYTFCLEAHRSLLAFAPVSEQWRERE
jgi:hypothetical protein